MYIRIRAILYGISIENAADTLTHIAFLLAHAHTMFRIILLNILYCWYTAGSHCLLLCFNFIVESYRHHKGTCDRIPMHLVFMRMAAELAEYCGATICK